MKLRERMDALGETLLAITEALTNPQTRAVLPPLTVARLSQVKAGLAELGYEIKIPPRIVFDDLIKSCVKQSTKRGAVNVGAAVDLAHTWAVENWRGDHPAIGAIRSACRGVSRPEESTVFEFLQSEILDYIGKGNNQ